MYNADVTKEVGPRHLILGKNRIPLGLQLLLRMNLLCEE